MLSLWCVSAIFGDVLEMARISLIDIKSGKAVEQLQANLVSVKTPCIVKVSLNPQDMKSYRQEGNNLVIELKSGGQLVLKDFFAIASDGARNELVLEHQGHYWHAVYGENQASLSLEEISGVDELLISKEGDATFMWLLGALGLGGLAVVATDDGDSGGGGGQESQPSGGTAVSLQKPDLVVDPEKGEI
ncbi:TPA: BapA prefix-like domain-containing protein, partial [Pseudomonas aeruginosa]|nr:BapA prefix-like domain-containing protein [Pseudomonas aeruginosa]